LRRFTMLRGQTVILADRSALMRTAIRRLLGGRSVVFREIETPDAIRGALNQLKPKLMVIEDLMVGAGEILWEAAAAGTAVVVLTDPRQWSSVPSGHHLLAYLDRLEAVRLTEVIRGLLSAA
jgi:DNA-binding NarL/FixJ family response regulator